MATPVRSTHRWNHLDKPCRPIALILGGNYRALGVVRSLGRRGVPVWLIKQDGHSLAGFSRYVEKILPWPDTDDSGKVEYLKCLASSTADQLVLIPTDDACTHLISCWHDSLAENLMLTTPPWSSLRWICDKRQLFQLGERYGIEQPRTWFAGSKDELLSAGIQFPAILKPTMHLELNPLTVEKAWRADHISVLLDHFTKACRFMAPNRLMVQELIPGGGESQYSYSGFFVEGQPVAAVVVRRARQYPSDFGRFSTFVETIEEPALQIPAFKILSSIDFTGLVEVEFKRDARDGRYKLLDINPRIWGWHSLCTSAGVDFSYLLWQVTRGEALPRVTARAGIRWARLGPDILVGISEICKGRLSLPEYLRSLRPPLVTPIFALDDLFPALVELPNLGCLLLARAMRHGWHQSASSFKKALVLLRREIGSDDTAKDPPS